MSFPIVPTYLCAPLLSAPCGVTLMLCVYSSYTFRLHPLSDIHRCIQCSALRHIPIFFRYCLLWLLLASHSSLVATPKWTFTTEHGHTVILKNRHLWKNDDFQIYSVYFQLIPIVSVTISESRLFVYKPVKMFFRISANYTNIHRKLSRIFFDKMPFFRSQRRC